MSDLSDLLKKTTNPAAKKAIIERMRVEAVEAGKDKERKKLKLQIKQCRACPLGYTRGKSVPWTGPTHGKGDIIIVGEAPGGTEDRYGEPFVGRAGHALDQLLLNAGTSRERCFIMNALCCLPKQVEGGEGTFREPEQTELDACRPNFHDQMELSGLKVGVALGGYAWGAVTGQQRHIIKVSKLIEAETCAWVEGRIWIPTYHPSYALRKAAIEEEEMVTVTIADHIVEAIQWALAIAKGTTLFPKIPWGRVKFAGRYREDIAAALKKKRWALWDSEVFGSQIVIVDDSKGTIPKLPMSLEQVPVYTLTELFQLGLIGEGKGMSMADLRRLHYVRAEMGGEVVA